jgi:dTDP-4-dehydrorhamnose reductase
MLITGAEGMLGQDVVIAAGAGELEAVALSHSDLDVTDAAAVRQAVADSSPDVVVNCAGWTDVNGAEDSFDAALAVNAEGPGLLASAAAAAGAWTIHISTDYVFDGAGRDPYVESDPTQPLSAYGRSKLAGEQEVAVAAPQAHTIVRSSWLFGWHGHCFPRTILSRAAERDRLDVVDDQIGCPTFTGHLATALIELAEQRPRGILHVTGSGSCSWYGFAQEIVAGAGLDCEVRPVATAQMPRRARRPAYSVLGSERGAPQLPSWRQGLEAFLAVRV